MPIPQAGPAPRVLVIGARGALGSLTAAAFGRAGWDVVAGIRRPDERHGSARHVDLDDPHTVAAAVEGVDVVVNPVPDPGMTAERIVLERGGALVILSALPDPAALC